MLYLPHTGEDISEMLQAVGVNHLDDLFGTVPEDCRCTAPLDLPAPMTEWDLNAHMDGLAAGTAAAPEYSIFMGAGRYYHHIPATVPFLAGRSEFVTAYTPYQPEMSQGTLQAIFEFQTLAGRLMGVDVATASHYDGATAMAEGLLMAVRKSRRSTVAVSRTVHPHYRQVVQTYFEPTAYNVVELDYTPEGLTDLGALDGHDDIGALAVQSPNFFGCIEDVGGAAEKIHAGKGFLVAGFTEALAYGLLKRPGTLGADIVAGEGQSLGLPPSYGGPGLGLLGSTKTFMRNLPGRLVGRTTDVDGRRGFVLTLATREQHIRREKATSNICTNNSLCALTAAVYMASTGGSGIRRLAQLNRDKAEYLKGQLAAAGAAGPFAAPTFNEFVVNFPDGFAATHQRLLEKKIVAGLPLEPYYPELAGHYLLCATETASKADMDALVGEVKA